MIFFHVKYFVGVIFLVFTIVLCTLHSPVKYHAWYYLTKITVDTFILKFLYQDWTRSHTMSIFFIGVPSFKTMSKLGGLLLHDIAFYHGNVLLLQEQVESCYSTAYPIIGIGNQYRNRWTPVTWHHMTFTSWECSTITGTGWLLLQGNTFYHRNIPPLQEEVDSCYSTTHFIRRIIPHHKQKLHDPMLNTQYLPKLILFYD